MNKGEITLSFSVPLNKKDISVKFSDFEYEKVAESTYKFKLK